MGRKCLENRQTKNAHFELKRIILAARNGHKSSQVLFDYVCRRHQPLHVPYVQLR